MEEGDVGELLDRLESSERSQAWSEFLDSYAPLILQVVHQFERDPDRSADCFVFVCEELSRNRCRRLRRYDPTKGTSFSTWVQTIVHNLCLDWHRKQVGRFRLFRSLSGLSALDEEVYRCVYARGLSSEETLLVLRPAYADLTESRVAESLGRIRRRLTPRQHWLLSTLKPRVVPLANGAAGEGPTLERQIPDPGPDPELLAERQEKRARLAGALVRLSEEDRLLVRLRYEQGLTLQRVASLAGLQNAQQADRRLKETLDILRHEMERGGC